MTTPERPFDAPNPQETEHEKVARKQKEVQAAAGKTESRDAGSANAQNTAGPETQPER